MQIARSEDLYFYPAIAIMINNKAEKAPIVPQIQVFHHLHTKCTRQNDGKTRYFSYICRCKSVIIHFQPYYNNDEQRIDPHSDDVFRRVCQDMFPEVCHLQRSRAPIRILVVLSSQLYCQYSNPRTRLSVWIRSTSNSASAHSQAFIR